MQDNIQVDVSLKRSADQILDSMGLSMSSAFTIFLKAVIRTNSIPFRSEGDPIYSPENIKYLPALVKKIDSGEAQTTEHSLIAVE